MHYLFLYVRNDQQYSFTYIVLNLNIVVNREKIKKDDVSFKSKSEVDNDNNLLGETSSTNSISQYITTVN